MFALVAVVVGLWLLMVAAPDTSIARLLRHWSVERPADWLSRVPPMKLWANLAGILLISLLIWLEAGDALKVIGMMAPELMAWATMFEIGTLVDALAATALIWSGRKAAPAMAWLQIACGRLFSPRGRRRRARRTARRSAAPANDEEPAFATAA